MPGRETTAPAQRPAGRGGARGGAAHLPALRAARGGERARAERLAFLGGDYEGDDETYKRIATLTMQVGGPTHEDKVESLLNEMLGIDKEQLDAIKNLKGLII